MLADVLSATVPTIVPAAVAVIAVDGEVVAAEAAGELVRYTDPDGTLAPVRPPARRDSVFDLASISKLFTTSVILSLVAEGRLDLDAPVATWLPAFYADRPHITLRHLLTHTAGLQPTHRVDHVSPAARMDTILATPITSPVGGPYLYTDVGMVTVGRIAEIAGAAPLDELVRARVTEPLGLTDTAYRRLPFREDTSPLPPSGDAGPSRDPLASTGQGHAPADVSRIAKTECHRAIGEVHDETAHSLGGVAGHAGVFSTADDVLRYGEALRLGHLPLTDEMTRDHDVKNAPFRHGLGVRIGDPAVVGPLTDAFGHSGFTGTSLLVDRARRLTVVLLTNAVHPVRGRPGIRELRHAVAAEALQIVFRP
ncbi:serine hydrolase domain-containing protein [Nonomuraea dietziae]|uniref:CubicO group peptidase (Beta-lactamase class C family) n=1 Tax=Nonomuraea dietziae TaxID=65515 RepID=A0A7W5V8F9_9ACTN|nr:serine hydrolase domain-containing protein [Nonomuraea dietziae]MBB3732552.1 CubicO group peptidase (beta-lactamase class C family) [Nonomuraea dietziae]